MLSSDLKIVQQATTQLAELPNRIVGIIENWKMGLITTHEMFCQVSEFSKLAKMRLDDKMEGTLLSDREFITVMDALELSKM